MKGENEMKKMFLVLFVLALSLSALTGCGRCKCMKNGMMVGPTSTVSSVPAGSQSYAQDPAYSGSSARRSYSK